MTFNPLDPNQTAQQGSFAAKLAAKKARESGQDANDTSIVDVSTLSESERAQLVKNNNIQQAAKDFKFAAPQYAKEAIVIVFDDSSSMAYQKIQDAHEGTTEFMRESVPNEIAVKIATLNGITLPYTCNLPSLAMQVAKIQATGGTPLYEVTQQHMDKDGEISKPTRMILFSDGEPNGSGSYNYATQEITFSANHIATIKKAQELNIPLDTCLIADAGYSKTDRAYLVMEDLAKQTGGIFLVFEKGKCSFKHGFKYLTKGNRLLLMDGNFKAKLEAGEV